MKGLMGQYKKPDNCIVVLKIRLLMNINGFNIIFYGYIKKWKIYIKKYN